MSRQKAGKCELFYFPWFDHRQWENASWVISAFKKLMFAQKQHWGWSLGMKPTLTSSIDSF